MHIESYHARVCTPPKCIRQLETHITKWYKYARFSIHYRQCLLFVRSHSITLAVEISLKLDDISSYMMMIFEARHAIWNCDWIAPGCKHEINSLWPCHSKKSIISGSLLIHAIVGPIQMLISFIRLLSFGRILSNISSFFFFQIQLYDRIYSIFAFGSCQTEGQ